MCACLCRCVCVCVCALCVCVCKSVCACLRWYMRACVCKSGYMLFSMLRVCLCSVPMYFLNVLIYSMVILRTHLHAMHIADKLIVDSDQYNLFQGESLLLPSLCYFTLTMINQLDRTELDRTSCYIQRVLRNLSIFSTH